MTRTLRPEGAWLSELPHVHEVQQPRPVHRHGLRPVHALRGQQRPAGALPPGRPEPVRQLAASGRTWRDWQESMPAPCYRADAGTPSRHNEYGAHHNPALYFTGLRASCRADNLPMGGDRREGHRRVRRRARRRRRRRLQPGRPQRLRERPRPVRRRPRPSLRRLPRARDPADRGVARLRLTTG